MFTALFQPVDWALLLVRIGIGAIFLYHGVFKWTAWKKDGNGFPKRQISTMRLLAIAEPIAGAALLVGFLSRLAAAGIGAVMAGAIIYKMRKWHVPFAAMNRTGWELDFLILLGSLALVFAGAGSISFDVLVYGF